MNEKVKKLSVLGMFAALAYVFVLVGRIPISSVEFLKYDPKDIVVAICGFIMGPVSALIVTVITSFLEILSSPAISVPLCSGMKLPGAIFCDSTVSVNLQISFPSAVYAVVSSPPTKTTGFLS